MLDSTPRNTLILVEHMEEYLYHWCLHEYIQMKKYLVGSSCKLAITNAKTILEYKGAHSEENNKNLHTLIKEFEEAGEGKCRLIPESVVELISHHNLDEPVCMLDMRAQKELTPGQKWSTLVFGGILGDHPPRDRPAPVRKYFQNIRHLGQLQLATDTAVLVTKLIVDNQLKLSAIPFIKEPTIKGMNSKGEKTTVQMEGFSYVSKELDIETGKMVENLSKKEKKEIYMSKGVEELLINEDLSALQLM